MKFDTVARFPFAADGGEGPGNDLSGVTFSIHGNRSTLGPGRNAKRSGEIRRLGERYFKRDQRVEGIRALLRQRGLRSVLHPFQSGWNVEVDVDALLIPEIRVDAVVGRNLGHCAGAAAPAMRRIDLAPFKIEI